jgi:hypothetical protein
LIRSVPGRRWNEATGGKSEVEPAAKSDLEQQQQTAGSGLGFVVKEDSKRAKAWVTTNEAEWSGGGGEG